MPNKKLLLIIPLLYLSISKAYALDPSTYSPKSVATAVASVNASVLAQQGIQATSSYSTIMRSNVSSFFGSGLSALGRPSNMLKLASGGIYGIVLSYAAIEGGKYLLKTISNNPDGSVTYEKAGFTAPVSSPAFSSASQVWTFTINISNNTLKVFSPTWQALIPIADNYLSTNPRYGVSHIGLVNCKNVNGSAIECDYQYLKQNSSTVYTESRVYSFMTAVAPYSCPANNYFDQKKGKCIPNFDTTTAPSITTGAPEVLPQTMSENDLNTPVTAQALATLINNINSQMAQNPNNIPIREVTEEDVKRALGTNTPKVGDFVKLATSPVEVAGSSAVPVDQNKTMTNTDSSPEPTDPNAPVTNKIDLGPDPGVGTPTLDLEPIPTASMILTPIFNLMPDVRNLVISDVGGTCPFNQSFAIPLFKKDYSFSFICDFLAQHAMLLQSAFLIFFGILSAIIILGA